jgi:pentatricopeptide repeat protein
VLLTVSFVKLPPFGEKGYRAGSVASVCDIGFAYTKTGKLDEAVGAYRKAIEWNPAYAYAHLDLGKVLMELGRLDEAEQSLSEAIRLEPDLAEAHFDLGNLYLKTGRLEPAEREFSAAFRLDPGNEAAGSNLIGVYLTQGRHRQAVRIWRDMKNRGLEVHPAIASWMERNARRSEPDRRN